MNSLEDALSAVFILVAVILVFSGAYRLYGRWLARAWKIDPARPTPAFTEEDGIDYAPAKKAVVFGHHFASIAGAGPITGPIAAAVFGWVPALIWIILGSIFIGGVHDFGSLFISVRHHGKSIGEVIEHHIGRRGKQLFSIFAWLTLVLLIGAFLNIVADTFEAAPSAASTSLLFIAAAVLYGLLAYRRNMPTIPATIIGLVLMTGSIVLGMNCPIALSASVWRWILLAYIFIASVTPVWILLQPRDYLNSFLLYALMGSALIGLLLSGAKVGAVPAFVPLFSSGSEGKQLLFPMLFITLACGAISGFHSLVSSGTKSKMVSSEQDIPFIGYAGMLTEGILAVIALIAIGTVGMQEGGALRTFAVGVGTSLHALGIPLEAAVSFVSLAITAFAMTSLDTATRLARTIFQEFFSSGETAAGAGAADTISKGLKPGRFLNGVFTATTISVIISGAISMTDWRVIWPIFGSANQLLASLALLALGVWLADAGRNTLVVKVPMIFMFSVTLTSLVILIIQNLRTGNWLLMLFSAALLLLAVIQIREAFSRLFFLNRRVSASSS